MSKILWLLTFFALGAIVAKLWCRRATGGDQGASGGAADLKSTPRYDAELATTREGLVRIDARQAALISAVRGVDESVQELSSLARSIRDQQERHDKTLEEMGRSYTELVQDYAKIAQKLHGQQTLDALGKLRAVPD